MRSQQMNLANCCCWVGMVGIIMMLHFGIFHLLALSLQACGFNARPNMQAPLLAQSLADFWGRRWNTAFNVLAERHGFRLLTPRIGPDAALGVVFLTSGLLHEVVITLPARAGYLTNRWRRAGLAAANLVFTCLPVAYGWVALKGVNP